MRNSIKFQSEPPRKAKAKQADTPAPATTAEQLVEADKKLATMNAVSKHQQGYSTERLAVMAGTSPDHVKQWLKNMKLRRSIY